MARRRPFTAWTCIGGPCDGQTVPRELRSLSYIELPSPTLPAATVPSLGRYLRTITSNTVVYVAEHVRLNALLGR